MAVRRIDELMRAADSLSPDELLELVQKLVARARTIKRGHRHVDLNALAGTLKLDEDPMAIQERMRREWE